MRKTILSLLLIPALILMAHGQCHPDFERFVYATENNGKITDEFANQFLPDELNLVNNDINHYNSNGYRIAFKDSHAYISISTVHWGVCGSDYVISFNENCEPVQHIEVSHSCDRDFSLPTSEYSGYEVIYDSIIEITNYLERPEDPALRKQRKDTIVDYFEITYETLYNYKYLVMSDGDFRFMEPVNEYYSFENELTLSNRILGRVELAQYNPKELRRLRNEIFAKKGYRFKSADLLNYFSQFDWYEPRYTEATAIELSEIERLNIALLRKQEALAKSR